MSGIFFNHLLPWVGPSFAKHSSSSLVSCPSATVFYNRADMIHLLPHLRWKRQAGEEVPIEGRKRWDRRRWERKGERKRQKERKTRQWEKQFCLTSLHSITINHGLKLAWRTVRVSLRVRTHHNIPLATSTHTHQSITPRTANNDWFIFKLAKSCDTRTKVRTRGQSFHKQNVWKVNEMPELA